MSSGSSNSQGPAQPGTAAERRAKLDTRVRADLRQAVWEAAQTMGWSEIRTFVDDVLREVASDAE